jgi:hypothetical protein
MRKLQGNVTGKAGYSIDEFCNAHTISRGMFYKIQAAGKGPRLMSVGTRKIVSFEAAADWRRSCESTDDQVAS